jgi:hypothetical protein
MVGARRDRDDEEPRREREEVHPDYARGQDDAEIHTDRPDFARGQRRDEMDQHEGDFAEGQEISEHGLEAPDHGDFARGQRREDPNRS